MRFAARADNLSRVVTSFRNRALALCLAVLSGAGISFFSKAQAQALPVCTLSIFGTADWHGNFSVDAEGRGGLAALYTLTRRKAQLLKDDCGGVILVHAGNFSGASNESDFEKSLIRSGINLVSELKFDGLGLDAPEIAFASSSKNPDLRNIPWISFDLRRQERGRSFILTGRKNLRVFLTSLTGAGTAEYDGDALSRLLPELSHRGDQDAVVLLLNRAQTSLLDSQDFYGKIATGEEGRSPVSHVQAQRWRDLNRLLILEGGARNDSYYRLTSGAHVCRLRGRHVCLVEWKYRSHELIQSQQSFIDLNGSSSPEAWVEPERSLMNLLPWK